MVKAPLNLLFWFDNYLGYLQPKLNGTFQIVVTYFEIIDLFIDFSLINDEIAVLKWPEINDFECPGGTAYQSLLMVTCLEWEN